MTVRGRGSGCRVPGSRFCLGFRVPRSRGSEPAARLEPEPAPTWNPEPRNPTWTAGTRNRGLSIPALGYTPNVAEDLPKPLRDDVRLLGELLGETLRRQENHALYETVERVRAMAKSARGGNEADFDALTGVLEGMSIDEALPVARAFSHFLTLANIAEQHHRIRRRRFYERDPQAPPQIGSCDETLGRLRRAGIPADTLHAVVVGLQIELVFTAHPTEVTRRTLMQKHRRIADLLALRDRPDLTLPEGRDLLDALRIEIAAAWETSEVRRERPSPVDEARSGLVVFEQTLWDALPRFLRVLDEALVTHTGPRPADGCGAPAVRVLDWRRSRRQPRGDRARDRDRLPADAVAGGEPVPARGRRAALRAVDERCQPRAARARRRCRRAVSRAAARSAHAPLCNAADHRGVARRHADRTRAHHRARGGSRGTAHACATARSWRWATASWRRGGCAICCDALRRSAPRSCASICASTRRGTPRP